VVGGSNRLCNGPYPVRCACADSTLLGRRGIQAWTALTVCRPSEASLVTFRRGFRFSAYLYPVAGALLVKHRECREHMCEEDKQVLHGKIAQERSATDARLTMFLFLGGSQLLPPTGMRSGSNFLAGLDCRAVRSPFSPASCAPVASMRWHSHARVGPCNPASVGFCSSSGGKARLAMNHSAHSAGDQSAKRMTRPMSFALKR